MSKNPRPNDNETINRVCFASLVSETKTNVLNRNVSQDSRNFLVITGFKRLTRNKRTERNKRVILRRDRLHAVQRYVSVRLGWHNQKIRQI